MPRGAGTQEERLLGNGEAGVPTRNLATPDAPPTSVVAEALCDLLTAPGAGITRIRIVNARPRLLCATVVAAQRHNTVVEIAYAPLRGHGTAVLSAPTIATIRAATRSRSLGRP